MYNILQYPYNPEPSVVRREMLDFANKPSIVTTIIRGSLAAFLLLLVSSCAEVYGDCSKRNLKVFADCIDQKFPTGASYADLDNYLKQKGFQQYPVSKPYEYNGFYYLWESNYLLSNYSILVIGQYSDDLKIIELEVPGSPTYCNKWYKPQFSNCIKQLFPIGSSYAALDYRLKRQGFKKSEDAHNNQFHYVWSYSRTNDRTDVVGKYSDNLKIVELQVR